MISSDIERALDLLLFKLDNIDLKTLGISEYNYNYLSNKLKNPSSSFGLYKDLLNLSFSNNYPEELNDKCIIDYGGGSGLFSLIAKLLGVGRVLYNDIYDVSCNDVKKLSKALNIKLDNFICGDIDDVINYINTLNLKIDLVCSFDVIEHIYDIKSYLNKCGKINSGTNGLKLVFGSGANGKNPVINYQLRKKHFKTENFERKIVFGHKKRDSLTSYYQLRKQIIKNFSPQISVDKIDSLARQTRGLIKEDIEKNLDFFIKNGFINYVPDDPTNTCDPLTGNWDEHIMNQEELKNILISGGFNVILEPGLWRGSKKIYIKIVKLILNSLIKILGKFGFIFSPYYVLIAEKNKK